jgi:hypothetical protein
MTGTSAATVPSIASPALLPASRMVIDTPAWTTHGTIAGSQPRRLASLHRSRRNKGSWDALFSATLPVARLMNLAAESE